MQSGQTSVRQIDGEEMECEIIADSLQRIKDKHAERDKEAEGKKKQAESCWTPGPKKTSKNESQNHLMGTSSKH